MTAFGAKRSNLIAFSNDRIAPFPAIREAASKSPGSTPKWPLNRFDVVCPKAAIAV
jgi:hypothetical protein